MKSYLIPALLCLFLLAGCLTPNAEPDTAKLDNSTRRLQTIGALSQGVEATLDNNQVTEAKKLNEDIQTLAETPTPEDVNLVMLSIKGEAERKQLDEQITQLILERRKIDESYTATIAKLKKENAQAKQDALTAEQELKELKKPLSAIRYGVVTLFKRFLYTIAGFGLVFLVLRIFATSNPIVGALFSVFEQIVAMVLRGISWLFPRMFKYAKHTPEEDFQAVKSSRNALVDTIETLYIRYPKTKIGFDVIFEELRQNLTETDKAEVARALKELGYKK